MTTPLRQFILKRGNTTVSSTYTGPAGEITYDTGLNAVRIHDGVTPGGNLMPSDGVFSTLSSNITVLQANVTTLNANAATQAVLINSLQANVTTLQNEQLDLGNLVITDQTISGTRANADIMLAPNGTGTVEVPTLRINGYGTITTGPETVTTIVNRLTLAAFDSNANVNLPAGTYGNPSTISAPWAAYQFTTTPSPVLQIGDTIAGAGIPAQSDVVYVGTSAYAAWVVANVAPPVAVELGIAISVTRERTNNAMIVSAEDDQVDISLRPQGEYGRITANASIHPLVSGVFNLGTPARRWREIWLGAGTLFVEDETLGIDLAIGARNGNFYIKGGAGLEVGEFVLRDNTIRILDLTRDIQIGVNEATGNVQFNRPVKMVSPTGNVTFEVSREGRVQIDTPVIPALDIGALAIIGSPDRGFQPIQFAGGLIHLTSNQDQPARFTSDGFGTNAFAQFTGRAGRGSASTPSALQTGDSMLRLTGVGWGGTQFPTTPAPTSIEFVATENYTDTAYGSKINIFTAPLGTATKKLSAAIDPSGLLFTGNTDAAVGITFKDSSRQTTAWLGDASLVVVNANVTAANAAIAVLQSNAATQATQISSIASNAVNVVTAGTGISVNRVGATVGIDNTGVRTVAGTANQVFVNGGTVAANAAVTLSLPQNIAPNSTVTFANLTITGNLNIEGNIFSSNNLSIDSKILYLANSAQSGSGIDGGGISLGNVNAAFARTFLYDYNADAWSTNGAGLETQNLIATDATFSGNIFSNGAAHFGGSHLVTNYDNAEVQIDSDRNNFSQLIHQNHNSGTNASTDFVAANDQGTDSAYYVDMGINSSTYNNPDYSITGPDDAYLFNNGANLAIGTQTANTEIRFHTSGTTAANLRVTITDSGLDIENNVSIGGTLIFADGSTQNVSANTLFGANLGSVTANVATLFANAATQQTQIDSINANVTAANAAIVTANSAVVSYVNTLNSAMTANLTAANVSWQANAVAQQSLIAGLQSSVTTIDANLGSTWSNVSSLFANAVSQESAIGALRANVTAANAAIAAANAAIVTANSAVVSYVNTLNSAMAANVTAANVTAVNYTNLQIQGVTAAWTANATFQENEITDLRANITAANAAIAAISGGTYGNANVAAYLPTNSTIQAINANITAANAAIVTANTGMKIYVDSLNSAMTANVTAANAAIVTANTGMKSYVDGQITTVSAGFTANASSQQTQINSLLANVGGANISLGNITIVDQTISGTVLGRNVNFVVNDAGASFIFNSNILPTLNKVYTLGTKNQRWAKSFHGPNSLDIDGILLDTDTASVPEGTGNLFVSNAGGITANIITSNTAIKAQGNITTTGNINVSANVHAAYYHGDGRYLTNVSAGAPVPSVRTITGGTTANLNLTTDDVVYWYQPSGTSTVSFWNASVPGKVVKLVVHEPTTKRTVNFGVAAGYSSTGTTSYAPGGVGVIELEYISMDGTLANVVAIMTSTA